MQIKESAENYLETILVLSKKHGCVRSIDVANEMNFTKASISVAMKRLREDDYITVDKDGNIHLTGKGQEIAVNVYERHQLIAELLITLGVSEETAYKDSCKIEHDLSRESFEKIKEFYEKRLLNKK
ncbi:MAG: metal-dependent transcriptional regulator [Ruminococcaceae bacterium]|nr:metal-dependent transcriptional regulator [Oscillospiraceae bacterium]